MGTVHEGQSPDVTMKTKLLIVILVIAVPAASIAYFVKSRIMPRKFVSVEVIRGPFEVTVTAKGKLVAAKSERVPCPISWTPVVWLIPEGTIVEKDQLIAKFDKREIEDELRESRANRRLALAHLKEAKQQVKATEESMRALIKAREAQLHIARLEVKDLESRHRPDDLKRVEIELDRAKAVLDAAKAEYEAMKEAASEGGEGAASVFTPADLRSVQLTYEKALADHETSRIRYLAVEAGSHPDTIEEAKLKAKRAELDLCETQKELPEKLKQLEAGVEKAKAYVDKVETELKRHEEDLGHADFESPAAGMLAYRSIFGRRLAKGTVMRKGYSMFDIPVLSVMHLKGQVRES